MTDDTSGETHDDVQPRETTPAEYPDTEERDVIGHVVPLPNDRGFVTKCDACTDDPDDAQGTIRDDPIYGDEVPYPECYDCGEVMNPEVRE